MVPISPIKNFGAIAKTKRHFVNFIKIPFEYYFEHSHDPRMPNLEFCPSIPERVFPNDSTICQNETERCENEIPKQTVLDVFVPSQRQDAEKLFSLFDQNKDEFLSYEEFWLTLKPFVDAKLLVRDICDESCFIGETKEILTSDLETGRAQNTPNDRYHEILAEQQRARLLGAFAEVVQDWYHIPHGSFDRVNLYECVTRISFGGLKTETQQLSQNYLSEIKDKKKMIDHHTMQLVYSDSLNPLFTIGAQPIKTDFLTTLARLKQLVEEFGILLFKHSRDLTREDQIEFGDFLDRTMIQMERFDQKKERYLSFTMADQLGFNYPSFDPLLDSAYGPFMNFCDNDLD